MARLPLPLELTKPVLLAGDLEDRAQLCSCTYSEQDCSSVDSLGVQVDLTVDVQVDDVIA